MNAFEIAASAGISALGWCLLQFVWQAAVVGVVYAVVRLVLPRGNPRYLAAILALVVMAACPIFTWHALATRAPAGVLSDMVVTGTSALSVPSVAPAWSWRTLVQVALPWLVLTWAIGVAALGARVFRQWRGLRSMLKMAEGLPDWQARARVFADRMGLRRLVPVLASVRVATPTLIGWLRPAVVMPVAVLARMPVSQIDLVLAHELAHLKRLDHIANLFQVVLETLFFYHPAVHWISREARNERELCCDTLALRVTGGERRDFVAALANLEALRTGHAELALAASGGVLAERAWFIAGTVPERSQRHLRNHVVLAIAATVLVGWAGMWWRDNVWQQRTAALLAATNMSTLRTVIRDSLHHPVLLPVANAFGKPSLLPVRYATLSEPVDDGGLSRVPVQIAPVGAPTFHVGDTALRPAPIAPVATPVLKLEQPSTAPRALHTVAPVYPPEALLNGVEGQVVVEFSLDAAGVPGDLDVVGASMGQFDVAALQALADWRFAPPDVPGRRYRQTFTFKVGAETAGDATVPRGCLVSTGTHICRQVLPGVVLQKSVR
ncbi:MAG: M56 family metallopeptidase [Rhodanobacteraceae bacterium]